MAQHSSPDDPRPESDAEKYTYGQARNPEHTAFYPDSAQPSHADLQEWHAKHLASEGLWPVEGLENEVVDSASIEEHVREHMTTIEVNAGFCTKCQAIFDNWPDLMFKNSELLSRRQDDSISIDTELETPYALDSTSWMDPGWGETVILECCDNTIALEAATRRGCQFCALMLQRIVDYDLLGTFRVVEQVLEKLNKPSKIFLALIWSPRRPYHILRFGLPGKKVSDINNSITIEVQRLEHDRKQDESDPKFPVSPDESMVLIKKWLSDCSYSHDQCTLIAQEYPTRLIRVSTKPFRLIDTRQQAEKPRYATLSHCWGSHQAFCLTSKNFRLLFDEIAEADLSRTIREATSIAATAGLEYLWVDSLCIIQDDAGDWETEASKMADVYGGSALNIAASSARDGSYGCLTRPKYYGGGFSAELTIGDRKEIHDFTSGRVYEQVVSDSHLATRGWVVQEKLLPTRTVHCGERGILWECKSKMASEFFPRGYASLGLWSPFVIQRQLYPPHTSNKFNGEDYELVPADHVLEVKHRWHRARAWYTECNLTFPSDKLIALAGIARAVGRESGDQYFAGLWRSDFENELCWQMRQPKKRLETYRAPSWSWASVDGAVLPCFERLNTLYVHVHTINVTTSRNSYSAVSGGTLVVGCSGMLVGFVQQMSSGSWTPRWRLLGGSSWAEENGTKRSVDLGHQTRIFSVFLDAIEEEDSRVGEKVYLLPIQGGKSRYGKVWPEANAFWAFKGLVLQPVKGTTGKFVRIGCFDFETPEDYYYQPFLELLSNHGADVAKAECVEMVDNPEHPEQKYLIHIV